MFMGIKRTSLTKASGKSESLRTTVPMPIVKQFNLQEGDELEWSLVIKNNEFVIEVKPIKRR